MVRRLSNGPLACLKGSEVCALVLLEILRDTTCRRMGAHKTRQTEGFYILVPRPNTRGIPKILFCRILLFIYHVL